jgi:hypothetical protein
VSVLDRVRCYQVGCRPVSVPIDWRAGPSRATIIT